MASIKDTLASLFAKESPSAIQGTPLGKAYPKLAQPEPGLEAPFLSPDDLIGTGIGKAALVGAGKAAPILAGVLAPSKYVGKTLQGLPELVNMGGGKLEKFGTDQRLVDIAKQHAADMGIPYTEQSAYAAVDPERAKRLAYAFELMKMSQVIQWLKNHTKH